MLAKNSFHQWMDLKQYCKNVALSFFLIAFHSTLFADPVVIVNSNLSVNQLTKAQVRRIFLGQISIFPATDISILVLEHKDTTDIFSDFYRRVANRTRKEVAYYRARALFTGKGNQPEMVSSDNEIIELISSDPAYIGYVDSAAVAGNQAVKIVYNVNE